MKNDNLISIEKEIQWFETLLKNRVTVFLNQAMPLETFLPPPNLSSASPYAQFVTRNGLGFKERVILMLALLPHIKPQTLDLFFLQHSYKKVFTEFGGLSNGNFSGFFPTIETAAFIIAGNNLTDRIGILALFQENGFFRRNNIIEFTDSGNTLLFCRPLQISQEYLVYLTTGESHKPDFGPSFPAALLTTQLEWEDLILEHTVWEEIGELNEWLIHGNKLLNSSLGKKIKRGYRALFYGPPGTGKTLTASLLGKSNNMDVYRIDLSAIVSKYIGETEKNLANVFNKAENKNWILFFDEADALFGKRTSTKDSKDRYANQEISYLLQRIEDFPGMIILATNLKANMDDAFARRFQSMIYFPMPSTEMRNELWEKAFGNEMIRDENVNFYTISKDYELTGGAISNVLRYCALKGYARGDHKVTKEDLVAGIRKELKKEGKTG